MPREHATRRFTKAHPCPVCGGHDALGRGQGIRCFGYLDSGGGYARCTREEKAGGLPQNRDGTYSHRLAGSCRCGEVHGDAPSPAAGKDGTGTPGTLKRRDGQRFRSYFTLAASLRRRYGEGTAVRSWVYRHPDGSEAFRVVRVDYRAPDGTQAKSYRPCYEGADGKWRLSRPPSPLPLYNLPAVLAAPPGAAIPVLEGEKCADIAAALGLAAATTSAHGAKSPWLTDWTPLAGRRVAILGDAGAAGEGYAAQVSALLADINPPAVVSTVILPGLADGEDIEQFVDARRHAGLTDSEILAELTALIAPSA